MKDLGIFRYMILFLVLLSCLTAAENPESVLLLRPGEGNSRNSEGDFIELADGRLLFIYTHFTDGAGDHAPAFLAARVSHDQGKTWSDEDNVIVQGKGAKNVMSVSLLRLQNNEIALFYLVKNSIQDCKPVIRWSDDEGHTWSAPTNCIPDQKGYFVLNNDRVVQLTDGRLVVPVALHNKPEWDEPDWQGTVMCYLSDDHGRSWKKSKSELQAFDPRGNRLVAQEPGVVELNDGRLMMFCRSDAGCQLLSFSTDRGVTWSPLQKSDIISPRSPASIERIPQTGDLLMVWNNHAQIDSSLQGKRTPLTVAVSQDEGKTWSYIKDLEKNPYGWFCYTAIEFLDKHVLMAYCAGDRRYEKGLSVTKLSTLPLNWIYAGK